MAYIFRNSKIHQLYFLIERLRRVDGCLAIAEYGVTTVYRAMWILDPRIQPRRVIKQYKGHG